MLLFDLLMSTKLMSTKLLSGAARKSNSEKLRTFPRLKTAGGTGAGVAPGDDGSG